MARFSYHQRRYRDDPAFRLHKVNARRSRLGLPLLDSAEEIGRDYGAYARQRARGDGGQFV